MDKKSSVSVLDLLLRPELPDVRRELPEKRVEVKRLSRLAGEPVVFRLKALTYDQTRRVQDKPRGEQAVQAVLLGCVEPDWKDKSLLAPGSVATPIDAIKSKLTAGEIDELAVEIQMLGGYIVRALEDVKNA
nr:MAG TPA: tail assembly chaperone protein [Caudoviricetes sp.]